ncbi:MAG: hypothetical protein QOH25_4004 [Acidobacteriota bacterium]|nr:hypothetical protein [Acidobacteriota bacterium]
MTVFAGRAAQSWMKLRHRKSAASTISLRNCRAGRWKASLDASRQRHCAFIMTGGERSYARNSPPAEKEQGQLLRCRNLCFLHRKHYHSNTRHQRPVIHQANQHRESRRLTLHRVCGYRRIFRRARHASASRAAHFSKSLPTRTPSASCSTQEQRCSSSASSSGCATSST